MLPLSLHNNLLHGNNLYISCEIDS